MNVNTSDRHRPPGQSIWIALILISGVFLSAYFACVTPFAALATLAALKLGRGSAMITLSAVWLTNQAIGYLLLGYPWTWDSGAWGFAIGLATAVATLSARAFATTRPAPLPISLPFVAAFAAFELFLYVAGFILPMNEAAFSASVVRDVFVINSVAICCLIATHHLVSLTVLTLQTPTSDRATVSYL